MRFCTRRLNEARRCVSVNYRVTKLRLRCFIDVKLPHAAKLMKFTEQSKEQRMFSETESIRGTSEDEDGRAEAITVKQTGCCLCTAASCLPGDTCQR